MSVRTTIYLDEHLLERMKRLLPPRQLNRFVNDVLAEKVDTLERAEIEKAMREGYVAVDRERQDLEKDWEVVETEGWPA